MNMFYFDFSCPIKKLSFLRDWGPSVCDGQSQSFSTPPPLPAGKDSGTQVSREQSLSAHDFQICTAPSPATNNDCSLKTLKCQCDYIPFNKKEKH